MATQVATRSQEVINLHNVIEFVDFMTEFTDCTIGYTFILETALNLYVSSMDFTD